MRPTSLMTSVAAAIVFCVVGCSAPGNDYSGYTTLPADGWVYGDTVSYDVAHHDSVARGDLVVSLRYAHDYQWRNVWLEITTMADSRGTVARRDTVTIDLRDKYGRPRGNGIGVSFQLSDTVARHVTHHAGAPVLVRHIMRADTLRGIEQIGVSFIDNK